MWRSILSLGLEAASESKINTNQAHHEANTWIYMKTVISICLEEQEMMASVYSDGRII